MQPNLSKNCHPKNGVRCSSPISTLPSSSILLHYRESFIIRSGEFSSSENKRKDTALIPHYSRQTNFVLYFIHNVFLNIQYKS